MFSGKYEATSSAELEDERRRYGNIKIGTGMKCVPRREE